MGHHLVLMPRFDAARVPSADHRAPCHFLATVPTIMQRLLPVVPGRPRRLRPVVDPAVLACRRGMPTRRQGGVDRSPRPRGGLGVVRRHRTSGPDVHLRRAVAGAPRFGRRRRRRRDEGARRRRQRMPAGCERRDLHAPVPGQRADLPLHRRHREEPRRLGLAWRPRLLRRRRLPLPQRPARRHVHRRRPQRLPRRDRVGAVGTPERVVLLGRRRSRRRSGPGAAMPSCRPTGSTRRP